MRRVPFVGVLQGGEVALRRSETSMDKSLSSRGGRVPARQQVSARGASSWNGSPVVVSHAGDPDDRYQA